MIVRKTGRRLEVNLPIIKPVLMLKQYPAAAVEAMRPMKAPSADAPKLNAD